MRFPSTQALAAMLAVALGGGARAGIAEDLVASRQRITPFRATYLEEIRIVKEIKGEGGTPGWGMVPSRQKVVCGVDADSSFLNMASIAPGQPADLSESFFTGPEKSYNTIEKGHRGHFGSHRNGMFNPAAAGYETAGYPIEQYLATFNHQEVSPHTLQVTDHSYRENLGVERFGSQTVMASVTNLEKTKTATRSCVTEWVAHHGSMFPKKVILEVLKEGAVISERAYTLLEISQDDSPLKFTFQEGGLVTDLDDNKVYNVIKGKLVEDPVFSAEARKSTLQRRSLFIGSVVALTGWGVLTVRRRRARREP